MEQAAARRQACELSHIAVTLNSLRSSSRSSRFSLCCPCIGYGPFPSPLHLQNRISGSLNQDFISLIWKPKSRFHFSINMQNRNESKPILEKGVKRGEEEGRGRGRGQGWWIERKKTKIVGVQCKMNYCYGCYLSILQCTHFIYLFSLDWKKIKQIWGSSLLIYSLKRKHGKDTADVAKSNVNVFTRSE